MLPTTNPNGAKKGVILVRGGKIPLSESAWGKNMTVSEGLGSFHSEVGGRIKARRKAMEISQSRLAELMGSSYQQIQKYENGTNQLTLGKLLQFANAMNVEPSYFYDGIPVEVLSSEDDSQSDVITRRKDKLLHILLVEDSPADALLFSKAASEFDEQIKLHCINNTELVMDYLSRQSGSTNQSVDLVVLDLSLPKISGLQLLKMIKNNSQTAFIPCIILTNSISRSEMLEAYRLGAAGFVQKSAQLSPYRHSIETVIRYWLEVVALPCD